ncbi:hypothetical protein LTR06_001866 [Exophiala xenobiotica]|nr:hypothetical protein LTR06_001866 [Exophiala xenobiotica]
MSILDGDIILGDDDVRVVLSATGQGGNYVLAARDHAAKSQLMLVDHPLLIALDTPQLSVNCYSCFRTPGELPRDGQGQGQGPSLQRCSGCKVVRFCDKICQKQAWSYHRLECKLYARLYPRILPSNVRAMVRLLKQQKAGQIPPEEWMHLLSLTSHADDISRAGGERWENLSLMTQGIQAYSGSDQSPELILRLLCTLTINSFTLTNFLSEPMGLALHPRTSQFNHSCRPNAFVRFDVFKGESAPQKSGRHHISVHALRQIQEGEEITLGYVDGTYPFEKRQQELKERYFFTCSCELCTKERETAANPLHTTSVVHPKVEEAEQNAEQVHSDVQSEPGLEYTQVDKIKQAMAGLAGTGSWRLHQYPWPQLRAQLLAGLLGSGKYSEAFLQSAVMARLTHPAMYEQAYHPLRLMQMFNLWNLCQPCMDDEWKREDWDDRRFRMLDLLSCVVLDDIHKALVEGIRVNGYLEHVIEQALQRPSREAMTWDNFHDNPAQARKVVWHWLDGLIRAQLRKEGVSQPIVDSAMRNQG